MFCNPPAERDLAEDKHTSDDRLLEDCGLGIKRLRAHRWERAELSWLSSVKLPWGLEVQLLNISSSGLLIESGSKIAAGTSMAFHLSGPNKNLVVPGRIVRSRVGEVCPRGVRYRAAAIFDKSVDLLVQRSTTLKRTVAAPRALVDLLLRVVNEHELGADAATLRATFGEGIRPLVGARQVEIRDEPGSAVEEGASVSFPVPASGTRTVLHAAFEPSTNPNEEEFRILKAAATLAGFVLQFDTLVAPPE